MTSHYKTEAIFDYSWRQVVQAYWNRYPNPSSSHVLTEDTICREVRDGKLFSRRLFSKTNSVPKWGERFYRNTPVKIIEDSILDPKAKTLITFTRNIGMKKIMRVHEIVEYSEREDGRTVAVRRAYISSQVFGFSRAIRAFGIERFKSNGAKTLNGFNFVLRNMFPNSMIANTSGGALALQPSSEVAKSSDQHSAGSTTMSKSDAAKKAVESSYIFLKTQATKLAQMFSIKN